MGADAPSPSEGFRLSPVLAYLCYNGGFFTKPARACARATIAAIDASLREEGRPLGDITTTY